MTLLTNLLAGNASFKETYVKYAEKLPSKPRKQLAIFTCSDTRLNPIRIFHINVGDAEIIRNAGNQVTSDVIRSLVVAIQNGVNEIIVLGHTDCSSTTQESLLDDLARIGGFTPHLLGKALGYFTEPETNVRDQASKIRSSPEIPPNIPIHGLLFDITNGTIKIVVNGYDSIKSTASTTITGLFLNFPLLKMPSLTRKPIMPPTPTLSPYSSLSSRKRRDANP